MKKSMAAERSGARSGWAREGGRSGRDGISALDLEGSPEPVRRLLAGCIVASGIVGKVREGRPLSIKERHVLFNVFVHLGEEGQRFIHRVLDQEPAGGVYDPDRVNREIHRISPQPMGCARIRRHLKLDPDRDGCNCVFRLESDQYETPLCHIDIFPTSDGPRLRSRPCPPDLDGDGRRIGYLSRKAKRRSRGDRGRHGGRGREHSREEGSRPEDGSQQPGRDAAETGRNDS